ncbi:MAG: potassium channel family protein [Gammaproteobacteria bacterium]|nr:potassium channel family protein [Gammaproteobacteria bacterium]MBQ0840471.1 potassium channel family protein [Gammaproteobacteria bacterium]
MAETPKIYNFARFIGAAGVAREENAKARRTGIILEVPMLIASLWILLNWISESSSTSYNIYDIYLWAFFIVETLVLSFLVNDTRLYLRGNWLNLIIIITGIPMLLGWPTHLGALRLLRVIIVFALLMHIGGRVKKMLSRNELAATGLASFIVIVMAGILMSALEPNINGPLEGIWWAWVTITTVGYGDVVPKTHAGRAFASIIIFLGLGLFAALTASFTSFFISQREEKIISSEEDVHKRLTVIERQLARLEEKIDCLVSADKQGGANKE